MPRWLDRMLGRTEDRMLGGTEQRAITGLPFNYAPDLTSPAVTQERALTLGPVFAAVRLLADEISTLPIKAYRRVGDDRQPMSNLPQLFTQLEDDGGLTDWLHECVTSLALRGNAYGYVTSRDGMQFPTSIMWLNPGEVDCDDRNPAAPIWYWQGRRINREDLLHIPWFKIPGKVKGLSPIEAYATTVDTGLQAQAYANGWFAAGGVPPGKFKNSAKAVGQEEAEIVRDRLVSAIRSRRPIVYGADWDYEPITIPPEQAQFVQTMRMNATQIAAIYGIPPEEIGGEAGGSLTYNTVEQNTIRLSSRTLRPWLVKLERKFFSIMPSRQYVKFTSDAMVRADLKTRYEAYKIAAEVGLLTSDEMRALEDRPPLPPDAIPAPAATPALPAVPAKPLRIVS
ncbi:MAG TPA: phage portal protein [Pseudonocardiaceae bacterium]|jgi:HK97 family phage portal protein